MEKQRPFLLSILNIYRLSHCFPFPNSVFQHFEIINDYARYKLLYLYLNYIRIISLSLEESISILPGNLFSRLIVHHGEYIYSPFPINRILSPPFDI